MSDVTDRALRGLVSGGLARGGRGFASSLERATVALAAHQGAFAESVAPPAGLAERVLAVALAQGFEGVRLERRLRVDERRLPVDESLGEPVAGWWAVAVTRRGEVDQEVLPWRLVEPSRLQWRCLCGRWSGQEEEVADVCGSCGLSLVMVAWVRAFQELGVDA